MNPPPMNLSKNMAHAIVELHEHDNTIVWLDSGRTAYYHNWRGKTRHGNPRVGTVRALVKREYIELIDSALGHWKLTEAGHAAYEEAAQVLAVRQAAAPKTITAHDIIDALKTYYAEVNMVVAPEVSLAYGGERRIDAVVVGSSNKALIMIEVKVDRQDFKHELEDPSKRELAVGFSSQMYFACPANLVSADEVPRECGLLELGKDGKIAPTKEAPHRDITGVVPVRLLGAVARALTR